jgi:hypothetical protein
MSRATDDLQFYGNLAFLGGSYLCAWGINEARQQARRGVMRLKGYKSKRITPDDDPDISFSHYEFLKRK